MMRSFDLNRIGGKINALLVQVDKLSNQRYFRIITNLLALGFVIYLLIKNFAALKVLLGTISISYSYILFAFIILVFVVVVIGGTSWQFINIGLGQTISWFDAVSIQLISNVSKYIPGTIWQYASKTHLSYKKGIRIKASSLAMVIEFGLTVLIGLCLMFLFFPQKIGGIEVSDHIIYLTRAFGLLGIVISLTAEFWGRVIFSRFLKGQVDYKPYGLLFSSVLILVGWILSVFAFRLISLGLDNSISLSISDYFFAYTSSLIGGLLVIPVPNGVGIREGIMVVTLQSNLPGALALILAGIARTEITLAEVLGYLLLRAFTPVLRKSTIKTESNESDRN